MSWQIKVRKFWFKRSWLNLLLWPLSKFYDIGHLINYYLLNQPKKVKPFVICVGNVTVGGAGKTLFAITLAKKLISLNYKVAFISRGYASNIDSKKAIAVDILIHTAHKVGDEPLLLANIAPTYVCINRYKAAQMASSIDPDIIIMDDGLQNNQVHKDYNFLIIDGDYKFGNGYTLPAGPLREPITNAYQKANNIVLIGKKCFIKHDINATIVCNKTPNTSVQYLAFCSLANPNKFYNTLKQLKFNILATKSFNDHHHYSDQDIENLLKNSNKYKLITTQKDIVKIPKSLASQIEVLEVGLNFDLPDDLLNKLN